MLSASAVKYLNSLKLKKYREEYKSFIIEGFHLVNEAIGSSYQIKKIILDRNSDPEKTESILRKARNKNINIEYAESKDIKKLSETESQQGILAEVSIPGKKSIKINRADKLIVALERINDPGNLGTIIRTCYWFGADKVLLSEGCVDIYNSKVIRASQGAIFHINIRTNADLIKELDILNANEFDIYITDLHSETTLEKSSFGEYNVFVFGNEASGISKGLSKKEYKKVKIMPYTECESLNAAVSTGIVLHYFRTTTNK